MQCIFFLAKGFPIRNIGILTQNGDFLPMLSPILENKKIIQADYTLSKVSKPHLVSEPGMLLLANYGSKMYVFDTTHNKKETVTKDALKYDFNTHKKEILPNTGMPYAKYGFIKSTTVGHYLWVSYRQ